MSKSSSTDFLLYTARPSKPHRGHCRRQQGCNVVRAKLFGACLCASVLIPLSTASCAPHKGPAAEDTRPFAIRARELGFVESFKQNPAGTLALALASFAAGAKGEPLPYERAAMLQALQDSTAVQDHSPVESPTNPDNSQERRLTARQKYVIPETGGILLLCLAAAAHHEEVAKSESDYNCAYAMQLEYREWQQKIYDLFTMQIDRITTVNDQLAGVIDEALGDKIRNTLATYRQQPQSGRDEIDSICGILKDLSASEILLHMEQRLFSE